MVIRGLWDKIKDGVARLFGREGIAPTPPVLEEYLDPPPPVLEDMPSAAPDLEDIESTPPQLEDQPIDWGSMDEPVPGDPPTMEDMPTGQPTLEDLPTQEPTQDEIDHATDGLTAEDMAVPEPRDDLFTSQPQTQSIRPGGGLSSRAVGNSVALSGPLEDDSQGGLVDSPGTADDPLVLYSTYEGSETAQTDTWDRDDQGDNDGVTESYVTRIVYNHSGDEKIYGFYRTRTYDSIGILMTVSAETRFEIDAAEDCDDDIDGGTY